MQVVTLGYDLRKYKDGIGKQNQDGRKDWKRNIHEQVKTVGE